MIVMLSQECQKNVRIFYDFVPFGASAPRKQYFFGRKKPRANEKMFILMSVLENKFLIDPLTYSTEILFETFLETSNFQL